MKKWELRSPMTVTFIEQDRPPNAMENIMNMKVSEVTRCVESERETGMVPLASVDITSTHVALLMEAYDFGQFAQDFDQPLATPIRAAICKLLDDLKAQSTKETTP